MRAEKLLGVPNIAWWVLIASTGPSALQEPETSLGTAPTQGKSHQLHSSNTGLFRDWKNNNTIMSRGCWEHFGDVSLSVGSMTHLHLNSLLISFSEPHNSTAFKVWTNWVALLSSRFGSALMALICCLSLAILMQVTFANARLKLAFLFFLVKT